MSTLLYSLGRWSYRHPWRVLTAWILLLVLSVAGVALLAKGTDNSFAIPGTESQDGLAQLDRTFPQASGTSAQIIVVAAVGDKVTDPDYATAVDAAINRLDAVDGVLAVTDPYDDVVRGQISEDASAAIVRLQFDGQSTDVTAETETALQDVSDSLGAELPAGSQVSLGGELFSSSLPAVSLTEALGLVIALLVLTLTFRSLVLAGMPLITTLLGIGISMALIFIATAFAEVSSTTPLLALMLGLAVGIDYSLFITARHQDQVRSGADPEESAALATGTAGSAVVFAGITVVIALIGLSFAGIPFLTTMGVAAAVAVAMAVVVAVTLTPAFLGFLKGRVIGWKPRRIRTGASLAARWVGGVTRHPIVAMMAVVVGLGIIAIPAASLTLALPNAGMLPEENPARTNYDLVDEHFGPGYNGPLVMTGTIVTSEDPLALMEDIGDEVSRLPGVAAVVVATPNETADTGIVQVIPDTAPDAPATAALVRELRAQHDHFESTYGVDLKVTGFTAVGIDTSDRLGAALLPFGIFVVGLSLILLTMVFRSLWVPLTAAAGYLLSVLAAFGVVGAVFEWGWAADLLNVSTVGPIISFMPIVVMGVLFGLAMDYHVFLVSRMREDFVHARRDAGGKADNAMALAAVRSGFTASARVVTAAAIIMFSVFAAFIPDGDSSIKPIALGLAAGIAVDAFAVRMTLVPAVMALLGKRAWFLPAWLGRILPRVDIEGEAVERERALADWPGSPVAIAADDVSVTADEDALFEPVTVRVEPGGALAVAGPAPAARAFGLTLAGRLEPTAGRLKVDGHLLPERAAWVRRRVGVAIPAEAARPIAEVRRALARSPRVVVIDGVDLLSPDDRRELVGELRAARTPHPPTVVLSSHSQALAVRILQQAGWTDITLLDLEETPAHITGVTV